MYVMLQTLIMKARIFCPLNKLKYLCSEKEEKIENHEFRRLVLGTDFDLNLSVYFIWFLGAFSIFFLDDDYTCIIVRYSKSLLLIFLRCYRFCNGWSIILASELILSGKRQKLLDLHQECYSDKDGSPSCATRPLCIWFDSTQKIFSLPERKYKINYIYIYIYIYFKIFNKTWNQQD